MVSVAVALVDLDTAKTRVLFAFDGHVGKRDKPAWQGEDALGQAINRHAGRCGGTECMAAGNDEHATALAKRIVMGDEDRNVMLDTAAVVPGRSDAFRRTR